MQPILDAVYEWVLLYFRVGEEELFGLSFEK